MFHVQRWIVTLIACGLLVAIIALPARAQNDTAGEYSVDPVHSAVVFRIQHMGAGYVYGRFNEFAGTFTLGENKQIESVSFTVQAGSIDTGNERRDGHLRTADFFNVAKHADITFKSTKIEALADDDGNTTGAKVTGDLTLLGTTRSITIPVDVTGIGSNPQSGKQLAGLHAKFKIQRSDYGMMWGVKNGAVGDTVYLMVGLEGGKQ